MMMMMMILILILIISLNYNNGTQNSSYDFVIMVLSVIYDYVCVILNCNYESCSSQTISNSWVSIEADWEIGNAAGFLALEANV